MRNGLNISNLSEFVHEIRTIPEEAVVRYRTRVGLLRSDLASVETLPAWAGTIRVARAFALRAHLGSPNAERAVPDAAEYVQAALGGCVLVTFVYGCSSKGIILSRLGIGVEADLCDGGRFGRLRYVLDVDADADDKAAVDIARYVSFLSPNHRTLVEPNTIAVQIVARGSDGEAHRELVVNAESFAEPVEARAQYGVRSDLSWRYGTQLEGAVGAQPAGAPRFPVSIDQPKQYLGIDNAPNPQELLFSALGADIISELLGLAAERRVSVRHSELMCEGGLDLRGVLNVESSAPVKVHALSLRAHVEADASAELVAAVVGDAVRRSRICNLICAPQEIQVKVRSREREVSDFTSNQRFLRAQLALSR